MMNIKFKIITLGCKVNAYESNMMSELLTKKGYIESVDDNLDLVIINTCSVTNMADLKSRKLIRYQKRKNPHAIIAATGCSVVNQKSNLLALGVDILIGNQDKNNIVNIIDKYLENHQVQVSIEDTRDKVYPKEGINNFNELARAYLKIQDGCNHFCTYCLIPYLRGISRCKDNKLILEEANNLVNNNHYEIVLTGVDTGIYNYNDYTLNNLITDLSKIDKLKRIRLSSIDIIELDDDFIELLKNNNKLCSHLHISLQSGCNKILKAMARPYTKEKCLEMVEKIRGIRPDISLTTDIIVGFPGESEEDFEETYAFAKEVGFAKIHVFPYSKRSGTKASTLPNQIPNKIKHERAKKLIALSNELALKYHQKYLQKEVEVLVEENQNNKAIGHTSNYLRVIINRPIAPNSFVNVTINKVDFENCYAD